MKTDTRFHFAAIGALALGAFGNGCVNAMTEDGAGAAIVDDDAAYYVFNQGLLYEANDAAGACRGWGGCRVSDEGLDLASLGFSAAEATTLKAEARAGQVVFLGLATPDVPAGHPVDGPIAATLAVQEVWRSPKASTSAAPYYRVLMPMTLLPTNEPYLATGLNGAGAGGGFFKTVNGVKRSQFSDVTNRGGIIVQGAITGTAGSRTFRAESAFRRWVPAAEYACDSHCGGFNSCISCEPGAWSCLDSCEVEPVDAVVIDQTGNGQTFEVSEGTLVVVRLPSIPTAGYDWSVLTTDKTLGYPASIDHETSGSVGGGGATVLTWQTTGFLPMIGTHRVELQYKRLSDVEPEQTFSFTIDITAQSL